MRILHVVDALSIGGAERHVVDLARAQADRGAQVTVACSQSGPLASGLEGTGVELVVLREALTKRRIDLGYAAALRRLVAERAPDLVHGHLYASIVASALATLGRDVPLVFTEQTESPWRGPGARFVSRLAYRRAAHVVGVSRAITGGLVERFGVPADRVTTIPNAVALRAADPAPDAPRWDGRPVIGVFARLTPEKGVDVFLDAAAELARRFERATFPIVGDGDLCDGLIARARRLGLDGRVRFEGFREDSRALLERLDVLVVPSREEGTPLTIVEAMHAGVPIVATRAGGIPEQIEDGRTGLLVGREDPSALAAAVARVVEDQVLAGRLVAAAREHARTEFHPDTMLRRIDAVYAAAGLPALEAAARPASSSSPRWPRRTSPEQARRG